MAIRSLNSWLDKNSYRIATDDEEIDLREYEETEEYEDGYQGILSRDDVSSASDEATAEVHKEEYLKENREELLKDFVEENYQDEFKDFVDNKFYDDRTADDYYPIWLTAWEFPTGYTAEQLNEFDIRGVVFFNINGTDFISLTTCGMDMTPSLEYAYFMYSNVEIAKTYIKERIFRQPSYFSYVVGNTDFKKLCEKLGITERKINLAEKRVKERCKEFLDGLNDLSKLRDSKKITQTEAGLLGLMQYFKHDKEKQQEVKAMA